jgi:site-specific DNA recombinase
MLENPFYTGKLVVPEYKDEEARIIEAIHQPLINEEVFRRVQRIIRKETKEKRRYDSFSPVLPLRGMLTCAKCGGKLTGSTSKGKGGYYHYYHCQKPCKERFKVEEAHQSLAEYLESIRIAPEICELYLAIMEDIFSKNEEQSKTATKKIQSELEVVRRKLFNLEDKYINGDLEKDTYQRMKPLLSGQIRELEEQAREVDNTETNYARYLKYAVKLVGNLPEHYKAATPEIKRRIAGSIFPDGLIYENRNYRTQQVNQVIVALGGFKRDFEEQKTKKATESGSFSRWVVRTGIEPVFHP